MRRCTDNSILTLERMFKTHLRLQHEGLLLMPIKDHSHRGTEQLLCMSKGLGTEVHRIPLLKRAYNVAGRHNNCSMWLAPS